LNPVASSPQPARILEPPIPSAALFWTLTVSTIGVFTASSLLILYVGAPLDSQLTTLGLWQLIAAELVLTCVWLPILRRRGWSLACVTVPPMIADVARGLGLMALCYGAVWLTLSLLSSVVPALRESIQAALRESTKTASIGVAPSLSSVLAVSIVNPTAEEFLHLGFLTNVLRRHGEGLAVAASVLSRVLTHLYQGPVGVLNVAMAGATLGVYYYRSSRLWPVIIAHSFVDVLALAIIRSHAGSG